MLTDIERDYVRAAINGDYARADELAALIDTHQAEQEARLNAPAALLSAALWYASNGVAVFPCAPGGKRPATEHGFKDATTDPERVRAWWRVNLMYNIGLPTGRRFDVVDLDGPAGLIGYGELMDAGAAPEPFAVALTPRGRHYYIHPTGEPNATNLAGLDKVDFRGRSGYVIAPPSRMPNGFYRWAPGRELDPTRLEVAA